MPARDCETRDASCRWQLNSGPPKLLDSPPGAPFPSKAVSPDQLESLLSGNGGLSTTALAEQTKTNRDEVLVLLRELEAAGRIRRTGQRRGTRWHKITDEDRIRERAAELEAKRNRPT